MGSYFFLNEEKSNCRNDENKFHKEDLKERLKWCSFDKWGLYLK